MPPDEPAGSAERPVDLRRCKRAIQRLYPAGHPLREAILAEPDFISVEEASIKIPLFLRLVGHTEASG